MRSEIFVDTSAWMSFFVINDPNHAIFRGLFTQVISQRIGLVTTNYVLTELVALLSARTRLSRSQVLDLIKNLQQISDLEIVHITPARHREAFELLQKRPDKTWSWVDAASFVVMTQRGLIEALTGDHHFEQAGFSRLIS